jgi:hypothetical protein
MASGAVAGQQGSDDAKRAVRPLQRGRLLVWVVKPAVVKLPTPDSGTAGFTPMSYKEMTSADFGKSANEVGKTAGSVGVSSTSPTISRTGHVPADTAPADVDAAAAAQAGAKEETSGSFGQNAGTFGTAASNHGESSGGFGQTASSYGTNAGNFGQTAGSFGESTSTIATAGEVKPVVVAKSWLMTVEDRLPVVFPGTRAQFVEMTIDKLGANLKKVEGGPGYPDVLVFEGFPVGWKGPASQVRELEGGSGQQFLAASPRRLMVMTHALHPDVARAFVAFLDQQGVPQ